VLDDALANIVPDVHAKAVRFVFMGKSDSTRPGPPVFIAHAAASRSLPPLLRALPAQPSREAERRYGLAALAGSLCTGATDDDT